MNIQFSNDYFQKGWVKYGLDSLMISDALKNPESTSQIAYAEMSLGLYLKKMSPIESLLVIGKIAGDTVTVEQAYRVKNSLFDPSSSGDPLKVLRILVDKFGLPMAVGNDKMKLVSGVTVNVPTLFASVDNPESHQIAHSFFGKESDNTVQCVLGFALDSDAYMQWLES